MDDAHHGWVTAKLGFGMAFLGNAGAWLHSAMLDNASFGTVSSVAISAGLMLSGGIVYFTKNTWPHIAKARLEYLAERQKILSDGLSGQMTLLQRSVDQTQRLNEQQSDVIAAMRDDQAENRATIEALNHELHKITDASTAAMLAHEVEKRELKAKLDATADQLRLANEQLGELKLTGAEILTRSAMRDDQADRNTADIADLKAATGPDIPKPNP